MANNAIATAYVQLIPTTKGLNKNIGQALGNEATNAGNKSGAVFGAGFAKKMLGALAVAGIGAKLAGFVRESMNAGGALQQSIGGIQTLFGDQADAMLEKANNAWRTAGVSANEYMQNITSFSASLLQSLGGDTAAAAKVSDRIMTDMADNANKFGSNIADIQHAYQGFSKQNYTMLDNLKLGYGGTKTEAERLVNEMSQMTDVQKQLGIEVKAGDLSFANLANAISVAQTAMGVAGTTAKEADSTLTGAFASMGAAWENLKGQMALGNDITDALDAVAKAAVINVKNIIPLVMNVLKALPGMLKTLIMGLGTEAAKALRSVPWSSRIKDIVADIEDFIAGDGLQEILDTLHLVLTGIVNLISTAMPILMPAIVELIGYLVQSLIEQAPMLLQAGLTLLQGLVDGLIAALPVLIEQLPMLIQAVIDYFATAWPMLLEAGGKLLAAIGNGIIQSIPVLMAQLPQIIQSIINFITWNLPKILQQGFKLLTALVDGIIKGIPQIGKAMLQGIKQIGNTIAANGPLLRASGQRLLYIVRDGLLSVLGSIGSVGLDIVRGIWSGISSGLGWIKSMISGWVGNVLDFIKRVFKIGSPSKLMADEVGRWIPAGIAVGIEDNTGLIDKAMTDLRSDVQSGFTPQFYQSLSYDGAATPAGGTSTIMVNIYATPNQSADDLYNTFERRLTNSVLRKEAAFA